MNSKVKELAKDVRGLKLDPEMLLDIIETARMRFYLLYDQSFSFEEAYIDISCEIESIVSSLLAPCLQLNNYLDCSAADIEWDEIKFNVEDISGYPSGKLRRVSTDVYGTSVLISIKSALDRLVRILSYYYPGISSHTTWGRYKDSQRKEGFMGVVRNRTDEDELLNYFHTEYHDWIKDAVAPRDQGKIMKSPYGIRAQAR